MPVEFPLFHLVHVIALRGLIDSGSSLEPSGYQFLAKEERIIRSFRKSVVADAEIAGMAKTAFPVECDITLEEDRTETKRGRFLEGVVSKAFPYPLRCKRGVMLVDPSSGPRFVSLIGLDEDMIWPMMRPSCS